MIAERITYLRERCALSQSAFAKDLHLSRTTIRKWEDGTSAPNMKSLISLAKYFSVSLDYLTGIDDQEMLSLEGLYAEEKESVCQLIHRYQETHRATARR